MKLYGCAVSYVKKLCGQLKVVAIVLLVRYEPNISRAKIQRNDTVRKVSLVLGQTMHD